jgi:prephenate dehydrogenase
VTHADAPFSRVGIVGLGLIGGSVALAARRAWPDITITAFDEHAATAEAARRCGVDRTVDHLTGLDGCDLLLFAVPVSAMLGLLPQLTRFSHASVITDVGSTKREVVAAAQSAGLRQFIGGHPMAGRERGGLAYAIPDLFQHRPWLLVAADETTPAARQAARQIEQFVSGLGAAPQWIGAEEHDRAVAFVSHLPQIVSLALMNAAAGALDRRGLAAHGRAFDEMTRLASSPPDLWEGILTRNADHIAEALAAFVRNLPTREQLEDASWIKETFGRAAAARARTREATPPQ